jgi:hypothetical protein
VVNANRNPVAENMQSQMMTMMFQNMSTLNNTLMTKLLAPPENPVNALAQLKDLLGIIPLLTGVKIPGVGGGRTDPWASIAETAIANVPRVLEAAGPLMDKWGAIARERTRAVAIAHGQPVPGDAPAAVGGGPGGAAIHVVPSIPPQQPTQAPAPPAATAFATDAWTDAPQQPAPKPAAPGNSVQVVAPDAQWIKVRLVNLIAKGMSGESLMDWLIGTDENMAVVLQQSSAEQIRAFFSMDPVLSQALSLPNFDQTLSEAIEYLHQGAQPAAAVQ